MKLPSAGSRSTVWASRLLTALAAAPFALSGAAKVFHVPAVVTGLTHAGVPAGAVLPLGIVELLCMALYLYPRTAVPGSVLLTGYLGGATLANLINRSDFVHALALGVLVWAGVFLRVAGLSQLVWPGNQERPNPDHQPLDWTAPRS